MVPPWPLVRLTVLYEIWEGSFVSYCWFGILAGIKTTTKLVVFPHKSISSMIEDQDSEAGVRSHRKVMV